MSWGFFYSLTYSIYEFINHIQSDAGNIDSKALNKRPLRIIRCPKDNIPLSQAMLSDGLTPPTDWLTNDDSNHPILNRAVDQNPQWWFKINLTCISKYSGISTTSDATQGICAMNVLKNVFVWFRSFNKCSFIKIEAAQAYHGHIGAKSSRVTSRSLHSLLERESKLSPGRHPERFAYCHRVERTAVLWRHCNGGGGSRRQKCECMDTGLKHFWLIYTTKWLYPSSCNFNLNSPASYFHAFPLQESFQKLS